MVASVAPVSHHRIENVQRVRENPLRTSQLAETTFMPPNVTFGAPPVERRPRRPQRRTRKRWYAAAVITTILVVAGVAIGVRVAPPESADLATSRIQSTVLPMTDDDRGGPEADEGDGDQPVAELVVSTTPSTDPTPTVAATTASEDTTTVVDCHPAYVECLPNQPEAAPSCDDLKDSFDHVHLVDPGWDPYGLDDDGNGMGCESS